MEIGFFQDLWKVKQTMLCKYSKFAIFVNIFCGILLDIYARKVILFREEGKCMQHVCPSEGKYNASRVTSFRKFGRRKNSCCAWKRCLYDANRKTTRELFAACPETGFSSLLFSRSGAVFLSIAFTSLNQVTLCLPGWLNSIVAHRHRSVLSTV